MLIKIPIPFEVDFKQIRDSLMFEIIEILKAPLKKKREREYRSNFVISFVYHNYFRGVTRACSTQVEIDVLLKLPSFFLCSFRSSIFHVTLPPRFILIPDETIT